MKKLTALLLCLVLCVSMFAACGGDEPAVTTGSAANTTKPVEGGDETTGPVTPDTDDTTEAGDNTTEGGNNPGGAPIDLSDLLPDYADSEKVALEDLGAADAGEVESGYETFLEDAVGITDLAAIEEDPYGNYYLTADIAANTTTVYEFYGVLDGCGHTITTSVPLFEELGGGIINLTLAGDIEFTETNGVLATFIGSDTTVFNVKNTCNITASGSENSLFVGGFAATLDGENIVFANCEYTGTITNKVSVAGNNKRITSAFVARIVGELEEYPPVIEFLNCTVSGTITASSHVGGLVGEAVAPVTLDVYGSVVDATITATNPGAAGGLLGYTSGGSATLGFYNCANNGNISAFEDVGGIIGSNAASGALSMLTAMWCTNYNDITGGKCIGGIVGFFNRLGTFEECVNLGNLTAVAPTVAGAAAYMNSMGGISGRHGSGSIDCEYIKCINLGNITAVANPAHLGGINGHSASPLIFEACVNFGDVISTFPAQSAKGEHRIGGITGGTDATAFSATDCVNFGDVKSQMYFTGQPFGGIVGLVRNSGALSIVNCMNYGNLDTRSIVGTNNMGAIASGLVGWAMGTSGITLTGSLNAGTIDSYTAIADLVSWSANASALKVEAMNIENTYYVAPAYSGTTVYGPFIHNSSNPDKSLAAKPDFANVTAIEKSDIEDDSADGLAAKMTAAADDGSTFKCVTVKLADGVETKKCVVSETVATLIADRIVTAD